MFAAVVAIYLISLVRIGPSVVVSNHWTGLLDWNTGMDYWTDTFLRSHLNARNMVFAINVYGLPVIRYSSPVLMWPVSELQYLDR